MTKLVFFILVSFLYSCASTNSLRFIRVEKGNRMNLPMKTTHTNNSTDNRISKTTTTTYDLAEIKISTVHNAECNQINQTAVLIKTDHLLGMNEIGTVSVTPNATVMMSEINTSLQKTNEKTVKRRFEPLGIISCPVGLSGIALGVLSYVFGPFSLFIVGSILGLIAFIFGLISVKKIVKNREKYRGWVFGMIGMIMFAPIALIWFYYIGYILNL